MKNKYITILAVIAVLLPSSAIAQVNLSNGLVANYTFSGNANDESGNSLNGVVNGATLTTDRFGNSNSAYSFDGKSDYINIPFDNKLNLMKDKSISLWYKLDKSVSLSGTPMLIYMKSSSSQYHPTFAIQLNEDITYAPNQHKIDFFFGAASNNYETYSKQNYNNFKDQWIHFVATYSQNSGYTKVYFNGVISDSLNMGNVSSNSSDLDIQIGRYDNVANTYFTGNIDDIRLYNRELNSQEIDSLYGKNTSNASLTKINTKEITIYPNPSKNSIAISVEQPSQVFLFDIKGNLLSQQNIDKSNNQLNITEIPSGIYILKVVDGKEVGCIKLIKE